MASGTVERHAVVGFARRVQVGELELLPQHLQLDGKRSVVMPFRVVAHQLVAGELQGLGLGLFGRLRQASKLARSRPPGAAWLS
jgi:hypothetical protein